MAPAASATAPCRAIANGKAKRARRAVAYGKAPEDREEQHARLASTGLHWGICIGSSGRLHPEKRQRAARRINAPSPGRRANARLSSRVQRSVGPKPPASQDIGRYRPLAGSRAARRANRIYERPQLLLSRPCRRKPWLLASGAALLPHRRAAFGGSNVLSSGRG